jgi:diguanylate cyclase (GGDEF)-like protein/PAS domain S-box-containing protein
MSKSLEAAKQEIACFGLDGGKIMAANSAAEELTGYSKSELIGKKLADLVIPEARTSLEEQIQRAAVSFRLDIKTLTKSGDQKWTELTVAFVETPDGKNWAVATATEANQRKYSDYLNVVNWHDPLTGLPNRLAVSNILGRLVARAKWRKEFLFAVVCLNLDRFRQVNESLGHITGDRLLAAFARRLHRLIRPEDTVARVGGDEFAIVLHDISDVSDTLRVAQRIQNALQEPFNIGEEQIFANATIGITVGTGDCDHPDNLLRDAEIAMHRAKTSGARHQVFDRAMHQRAVKRLRLETDLRWAVERSEFLIQYQPIVTLDDGKLVGFEALARWQHPIEGLTHPPEFIAVAEETGIIVPLGYGVLEKACAQMCRWMEEFPAFQTLQLNVNLSPRQLMQLDMLERVQTILQKTGLRAQNLTLEITESMVIQHPPIVGALGQLKEMGVQLCIDDFGTGYSSLSYLPTFPIDTLKIDRTFIREMQGNPRNLQIIRAIINLAHGLGIKVVAEGVEDAGQIEQLRSLNCHRMQGFFFSHPVDSVLVAKLLSDPKVLFDRGGFVVVS